MNSETFRQNKKKKEKKNTQIQRTFFPNILSDKFQQIALKFAALSCLSLSFLFPLYKIPFLKLYCLCYLFESVSELEKSCGTYCLNLPFEFTV